MQCEDFQEDLVSFVLNELSDDRIEALRKHLVTCEKCSKEAAGYRQTLQALSRWNVPAHGRPPIFALPPDASRNSTIPWSWGQRIKRFAIAEIAGAFAVIVTVLFLFGTEVRYERGALSIDLGRVRQQAAPLDSMKLARTIEDARQQDVEAMTAMLKASEARQAELYRSSLTSFSRQLNDQQRSYLVYVLNHLHHLQQQDQIAYYQSRAALDGVIKLANSTK